MTGELDERLSMPHLRTPATGPELRQTVDRRLAAVGVGATPDAPAPDVRDKPLWYLDFSFTDSRGKVWEGRFTSKIRNLAGRTSSTTMRAALIGGQPIHSVSAFDWLLATSIAYCEYALEVKGRPDWAKDLLSILDPMVMIALYQEAVSHETVYFRRTPNPGTGGGAVPGPDAPPGGVVDQDVRPPGDGPPVPSPEPR